MKRAAPSVAVIGAGNMGGALAAGWVAARAVSPSRIRMADARPDAAKALAKSLGARAEADNARAVDGADVVFLCVKPQQMGEVLDGLRGRLRAGQLVVSIAAGVRTDFIEKRLGRDARVVRVMPNTPALYRAGALVYCLGRRVARAQEETVRRLLAAVGSVWKAAEKDMDAVTALSGSGPAYVFFLAENLAAAGRKLGLPAPLAEALARQTLYGAGVMLRDSPEPAEVLRRRVTSPGGTTEAALKVMTARRLPDTYFTALAAACRRSRELSNR